MLCADGMKFYHTSSLDFSEVNMLKMERSVYWKIFNGWLTFLIANVIAFIFWIIGIENRLIIFQASVVLGALIAIPVGEKINTIPYDEDYNDNIKFLLMIFLFIIILIVQAGLLPSRS